MKTITVKSGTTEDGIKSFSTTGEPVEEYRGEGELKDAVEKPDGKIEVYDVKPLYGIRELGWKEIKVWIVPHPLHLNRTILMSLC